MRYKFDDDQIHNAVQQSETLANVLRILGMKMAGGNYRNLQIRIAKLGISTAHFTGKAHQRGKVAPGRKTAEMVLIDRTGTNGRHQSAGILRRSLLEIGRKYECVGCKDIGTWMGRKLTLEIDHVDGNWLDDRQENLRFLCPNCHSQTPTFRNYGRVAELEYADGLNPSSTGGSNPPPAIEQRAMIFMRPECPKCGTKIAHDSMHCRRRRPRREKIRWPELSVLQDAKRSRRTCILAEHLGVSETAIRKRIEKLTRTVANVVISASA